MLQGVEFAALANLSQVTASSILGDFVFNGAIDPNATPPTPDQPLPTPQSPTAKSVAKADFKLTHDDHSLLIAKAYLLGDKNVIRSAGLYTVIDHYHQYGIEYKREFLRLAKSY